MNSLNPIPKIINEKISSINTVFVFPTQTSVNMWADWAISSTTKTAVAMERFMAWDDFKGASIRSTHQDKTSIPGTMRKIFASNLIQQNSEQKFLNYIITKEYAKNASGFTDWIASILPSLAIWKKRFEKNNLQPDDEDLDYLEIYNRYKEFLDSNSMFDPAWETPPFDAQGKQFVIFFPEILMDYIEYKEILEQSEDIEIVHVPESNEKPVGHFYHNSREELRQTCLKLRKIHEEKNIAWQDMAVSVFDLETWGPYIDREMDLFEIPHVQHNGVPLTSSLAGNMFLQIRKCVSQNFSYDSVKSLLLNTSLPWTDFSLNQRLIQFGRENNCLCSFPILNKTGEQTGQYDVWENSFNEPLVPETVDEKLINIYRSLKKSLSSMVNAKSFDEIRSAYFSFRQKFFDVEKFSVQSDRIISRCITELGELIDLEEDFPEIKVNSPYSFFTDFLGGKNYVPQTQETGVQILPYRLSSTAPFKVQVILDASQAAISVVYKQLAFLSDEKRASLGINSDPNVSPLFVELYSINSQEETIFSAAEKTFTGYGLTSSYLEEKDHRSKEFASENLDSLDTYLAEKKSILAHDKSFPDKITSIEKNGFNSWKKMNDIDDCTTPQSEAQKKVDSLIDQNLLRNGKVKITYSILKYFYEDCHTFMKQKVLSLDESINEADLMPPFTMGNLNHSIFEHFCKTLQKKNLPLTTTEDGELSDDYKAYLTESIDEAISELEASVLSKQLVETSRKSLEETIFNSITSFCNKFYGYEIYAIEKNYSFEPEGKPYYFDGRVDCILRDPNEGECILVDFKSSDGAIPKKSFFVDEDVIVPDFQMPIYIHLLENQNPSIKIENCGFFNVSKGELVPVIGPLLKKKNDKTLDLSMKRFLELSEFYASKVLNHDIDSEDPVEQWENQIINDE